MIDAYLGEIRMVGFNFAPAGWAVCAGQLLPISQYTALFSLLGTSYGGDGVRTFALPNLQGRAPVHFGQGAGLSPYFLGAEGGEATHQLTTTEMPAHAHTLVGTTNPATATDPQNQFLARASGALGNVYGPATNLAAMSAHAVGLAGANQPHNNMQPYLALNFIIALDGTFPPHG
jgi:microcystin-dependent protein